MHGTRGDDIWHGDQAGRHCPGQVNAVREARQEAAATGGLVGEEWHTAAIFYLSSEPAMCPINRPAPIMPGLIVSLRRRGVASGAVDAVDGEGGTAAGMRGERINPNQWTGALHEGEAPGRKAKAKAKWLWAPVCAVLRMAASVDLSLLLPPFSPLLIRLHTTCDGRTACPTASVQQLRRLPHAGRAGAAADTTAATRLRRGGSASGGSPGSATPT